MLNGALAAHIAGDFDQSEACVAFIESQRHEGWACTHYDDGGYSGATLELPTLKRLFADIAAGRLDCVVIINSIGSRSHSPTLPK